MVFIPRIENVAIDRLVEPPSNPNRMEGAHFDLLRDAIADPKVGFLQPLLVRQPLPGEMDPADETIARLGGQGALYRIVDGVHRFRAARDAGATELPCVILDANVSDAMIAALQIGMNRLRGELNLADVAKTLAELFDDGWSKVDLTRTGMTEDEINDLLKASRATVDDVLANADLGNEPEETPEPDEGTFELTIVFTSSKDLARARKALKKAAGKGKGLDVGLLRVLDGASE